MYSVISPYFVVILSEAKDLCILAAADLVFSFAPQSG
jgi:hypothetical protein